MALSIASIKQLLASEGAAASEEVSRFISWVEGKDQEVSSALAQFNDAATRLQAAGAVLQKAGYTVQFASITPPAQ